MSDMLPGLFESELPQDTSDDIAEFQYSALDTEDREFVQAQEYEIRVHWTRAADEILAAGEKLLLVQARLKQANKGKNGSFSGWLKKVGLSEGNAFFAIKAFGRFGQNKNFGVRSFSPATLKELTYASDEVVEQVISGDIPSNSKAIREAEQARKRAEEAEKQARIAVTQARADALAAQQQLLLLQEASLSEIDALNKQLDAKKQEIETLLIPEIEIRTVKEEVVPQSVQNQLEDFQKEIDKLKSDLEAEKKTIPSDTQKKLDDLQKLVDRLKQQEVMNKQQQERIDKLTSDLQSAVRKGVASENDERIRQDWRHITSEARSCLMRLLAQWPSPIDVQSFDADDWARADQLKQTLRRVMEECDGLRFNGDEMIVDDHMSRSPVRVIDSM